MKNGLLSRTKLATYFFARLVVKDFSLLLLYTSPSVFKQWDASKSSLQSWALAVIFQRLPPLGLDSLQVYILQDTLFSSTFVNEESIWLSRLAWWGRLSVFYLGCQIGLFSGSSLSEFRANGGMCIGKCRCACARRNFTIIFPFKPRQLTSLKTAVLAVKTNFWP